MNDYSHALIREIAAQRAGFEPSHVWGRIVGSKDLKAPKWHYRNLMNSDEPDHLIAGGALDDVKEHAKRFVGTLPETGHVQRHNFKGL